MSRQTFVAGWRIYGTGAGPQLWSEMYWSLPADENAEAWVALVPGKWTLANASIPPHTPTNTDPDNIYYEIKFAAPSLNRPPALYWDPRTGKFITARPIPNPPKQPSPDPRIPVPVVLPAELLKRLAVLDALLSQGVISQQLHDDREAELVRMFT